MGIYCSAVVEWMHPRVGEQLWMASQEDATVAPLVSFPVAAYIRARTERSWQVRGNVGWERFCRVAGLLYWRSKLRQQTAARSKSRINANACGCTRGECARYLLRKFDWKEYLLWTNSNSVDYGAFRVSKIHRSICLCERRPLLWLYLTMYISLKLPWKRILI